MKMILAIHGHELSYDYQPKVEARPVYTVYETNSGTALVNCAQPELAYAVLKFINGNKWEIRDGAPIIFPGYILKPSKPNPALVGADLSIQAGYVAQDELIAKTMLEAVYVLGYDILSK